LDSQGKFESALPLYQQSLSLSKKIDDQQGVGESLNNIADLYQSQGNIELAIQFFRQSLAVSVGTRIAQQVAIRIGLKNLTREA
jgi:tetratricopeptide (TPR) repeat protein